MAVSAWFPVYSQNRWVEDAQARFKISVPENYKMSSDTDGGAKIYAFMSPDQNVAVLVNTYTANLGATLDNVISDFLRDVLKGAVQLTLEPSVMNGIQGRAAGYKSLVSDDALIEHMIPEQSKISSSETGKSVWDVSGNLGNKAMTMVIQNILKQGRSLNEFINEQATIINNQPEAFVRHQNYSTVNGLNICNYWYENKGNVFIYTAVDGPASFYVIGFVGSVNYEGELEAIHKSVYPTIRRSGDSSPKSASPSSKDESGKSSSNLSISSASLSVTSSGTLSGSNDITPLSIKVGTSVNSLAGVDQEMKTIPPSAKRIHMVFDYTGGEVQNPFKVKWSSNTHDCLIIEENYLPRVHNMNRIHSYIDNGGNDWPVGDYIVEVWHGKRMITLSTFNVGTASVTGQTNLQGQAPGQISQQELQQIKQQLEQQKQLQRQQQQQHQDYLSEIQSASPKSSSVSIKQIVMDNQNNGYDFVTGKLRSASAPPDPDVLNEPWCTNLPGLGGNWANTGMSRMEDVVTPPSSGYISDGYDFINAQEAPLNKVLVFKLKNGKYAKLMITKDDFTRSGNSCQHKITCLVEYPAF